MASRYPSESTHPVGISNNMRPHTKSNPHYIDYNGILKGQKASRSNIIPRLRLLLIIIIATHHRSLDETNSWNSLVFLGSLFSLGLHHPPPLRYPFQEILSVNWIKTELCLRIVKFISMFLFNLRWLNVTLASWCFCWNGSWLIKIYLYPVTNRQQ